MTAFAQHMRPVAAEYLTQALPKQDPDGWNDQALTAWQFGCMALASLGYASLQKWGASRRTPARDPKVWPRWDDIAWVVLSVLAQRREIEYRQRDGTRFVAPARDGQLIVKRISPPPPAPPEPNIQAAHGAGHAFVRPEHLPLLEVLELVENGAWSARAELLLWRAQPRAWGMSIQEDARFQSGLERCLDTMPQDVVETMHDMADIDAEKVDASVAQQEQANADLIAKHPAQAKFDRTVSREGQFKGLIFHAKTQMDRLFFEGWRLQEGWLDGENRTRALPLFHDPLAMQMRQAAFDALGLAFPREVPV
ncbi:hypothetical protein AIOL_002869 [Candidatus Rhodobacter oscarellae]|uniref:Uncharacterized protein n=1 Tax=Candidatus Rhodobacter oscarellae TaxID=1675527 RepID=A0A0J9E5C8_9RHOB|nr:hypothetical protein [Candidatus Rhodobacter lobularis]KMW57901.1 hypothetical protein AIOL_002869 [Candidatus Rhodobacter lobularis]